MKNLKKLTKKSLINISRIDYFFNCIEIKSFENLIILNYNKNYNKLFHFNAKTIYTICK